MLEAADCPGWGRPHQVSLKEICKSGSLHCNAASTKLNGVRNLHSEAVRGSLYVRVTLLARTRTFFKISWMNSFLLRFVSRRTGDGSLRALAFALQLILRRFEIHPCSSDQRAGLTDGAHCRKTVSILAMPARSIIFESPMSPHRFARRARRDRAAP